MTKTEQPSDEIIDKGHLVHIAEMLGLEIDEESLAALADQLREIEALEESALGETPPILKMDASWHD